MQIPMKNGWMFFSSSSPVSESTAIKVPAPDKYTFSKNDQYKSKTAADGTTVMQKVARERTVLEFSWSMMDVGRWMNLWQTISGMGNHLYCKYYDHNFGAWMTRKVLITNSTCQPYRPNTNSSSLNYGKATYLRNCKFTVTDLGE